MRPKGETWEAARETGGWRESVRSQALRHLCALKPDSSHFDSDPRSSAARPPVTRGEGSGPGSLVFGQRSDADNRNRSGYFRRKEMND